MRSGVEFKEVSADGSEVFFTTEKQMTPDDTDTSRDLYVWNEPTHAPGNRRDPDLRQRQSARQQRQLCGRQLDRRNATSGSLFKPTTSVFDPRMAKETGEIYFYSPEQLDGARGVPNKRNLYV